MGDVGERVGELSLGERPARPVGEARRLVDARLGEVVDELLVGDRSRRSRTPSRRPACRTAGAGSMPPRFQTISRSCRAEWNTLMTRSSAMRSRNGLRSRPARERVDEHALVRRRHLDEAELRVIGRLAHELRVDGDERMRGEARAGGGEGRGRGDEVHRGGYSGGGKAVQTGGGRANSRKRVRGEGQRELSNSRTSNTRERQL